MEGNLCRCSAYKRILEAIESVVARGGRPAMSRRPRPPLVPRSSSAAASSSSSASAPADAPRPGPRLSHRRQRLPAHRRGRPRHRLLRQDRDGPGRHDLARADGGRGARRRASTSIEMVMGDTDRCPWDMGTFGSLTTRMFGPALRAAAAEARQVLLQLASEQLGVPEGPARRRERRRLGEGRAGAQGQLRRAREGPGDHADARREGGAAGRRRSSRSWAARPGGSTPSTR